MTEDYFSLHIIPETLRVTTIKSKSEGDRVNIEIDSRTQAIVDTIRNMEVFDEWEDCNCVWIIPIEMEVQRMLEWATDEAIKSDLSVEEVVWVPGAMEVLLVMWTIVIERRHRRGRLLPWNNRERIDPTWSSHGTGSHQVNYRASDCS